MKDPAITSAGGGALKVKEITPASQEAVEIDAALEIAAAKSVASGEPGCVDTTAGCVSTAIETPEIAAPCVD
jgi:hypothetical protein